MGSIEGKPESKRPPAITGLAIVYFVTAAGIVLFLLTNFVLSFPLRSAPILIVLAPVQFVLGRGLWKLRNWARIVTVILSASFGLPSVVEILIAFKSLDATKLVLNLSFVTLQGMVIWYLLHSKTRRCFETPMEKLSLF